MIRHLFKGSSPWEYLNLKNYVAKHTSKSYRNLMIGNYLRRQLRIKIETKKLNNLMIKMSGILIGSSFCLRQNLICSLHALLSLNLTADSHKVIFLMMDHQVRLT